jgi:prepilin-type N-terminal cleavage/methylation domain-containing protein
MIRRGFTIVEITITVTIMGILLVLAFVNLSSSQARARDAERNSDVETIGRHLESYYTSGTNETTVTGVYPGTTLTNDLSSMKLALRDADPKTLTAPRVDDPTETFKSATNAVETTGGVAPQPTVREYIYQPLGRSTPSGAWVLCGSGVECRRFNIFYRLEADDAVYKFSSRNQ